MERAWSSLAAIRATGPGDLARLDLATGEAVLLASLPEADDHSGKLSPVRDELVFVSDRDGSRDIFLLELPDGVPRNLTRTPDLHEGAPHWSPDGEWLVILRFPRRGLRGRGEPRRSPARSQERAHRRDRPQRSAAVRDARHDGGLDARLAVIPDASGLTSTGAYCTQTRRTSRRHGSLRAGPSRRLRPLRLGAAPAPRMRRSGTDLGLEGGVIRARHRRRAIQHGDCLVELAQNEVRLGQRRQVEQAHVRLGPTALDPLGRNLSDQRLEAGIAAQRIQRRIARASDPRTRKPRAWAACSAWMASSRSPAPTARRARRMLPSMPFG